MWEQLTVLTMLILLVAAIISPFLGDDKDTKIIIAIDFNQTGANSRSR
ncbi:MAG: hypothetical protein LH613_11630 [Chamaesiphon sp.]|nr:hypothetical protein [Chamaesiphon sp.]